MEVQLTCFPENLLNLEQIEVIREDLSKKYWKCFIVFGGFMEHCEATLLVQFQSVAVNISDAVQKCEYWTNPVTDLCSGKDRIYVGWYENLIG